MERRRAGDEGIDRHEPGIDLVVSSLENPLDLTPRRSPLPVAVRRLFRPVESGRDWLVRCARADLAAGRGGLWYAVVFGLGILAYFGLPREPSLAALVALLAALSVLAYRLRTWGTGFFVLLALATFVAGLVTAKVKTDRMAAPILKDERLVTTIEGWTVSAEATERSGHRLILAVSAIDGVAAPDTPRRAAVTVSARDAVFVPGDAVALKAVLYPPSAPVLPGGYDFRRQAYFEGRGALGFALGRPLAPPQLGPPPLTVRITATIAGLRGAIAERIGDALDGEAAAIATALIVGERRAIPEAVSEALRASGLAHILAISGLHLTLVAGTLLVLVRGGLALFPSLALNRPIRKWAAASALVATAGYVVISGAGVATQRAFVMLAVVLIAVMIDRAALTMRNVALAALFVLLIAPESLLGASFQMSFAAVAALVAVYENWRLQRFAAAGRSGSRPATIAAAGWRYVAGLAVTSLIAGLATAPFAAHYFHRVAAFGLLANLLAMPLVALVVMPMGLVAVLLMPFGLESVGLAGMAYGIDGVVAIARWVADLPGAVHLVPATGALSLAFAAIAIVWFCLWQRAWRHLAVIPLAAAGIAAFAHERPEVLAGRSGEMAAIRMADGRLALIGRKVDRFVAAEWLRADGDDREPKTALLDPKIHCDSYGCAADDGAGRHVSISLDPGAFDTDCRIADVVITPLRAPRGCDRRAVVVDGAALDRRGAHAIFWDGEEGNADGEGTGAAKHQP
ncbi:MAG: ComEC/Rec2 family competence protein, partial [Hyphomicrobiales bacterium]|nr:ComEC/Rec2 family competence protein [Hyphomicrobiales bacterium]